MGKGTFGKTSLAYMWYSQNLLSSPYIFLKILEKSNTCSSNTYSAFAIHVIKLVQS